MNSHNTHKVRWKTVALPIEHGGWSFLLEPILLGILAVPSIAGIFLAIAASGVFLSRHPFKIILADRKRGKRYSRTIVAVRFFILYSMVTLLSLIFLIYSAGILTLQPIIIAAPFALIYLIYDSRKKSRDWLPELCGSIALTASASCIALAGGWTIIDALMLWLIMICRVVPSILYVRARLSLEKVETEVNRLSSSGSHLFALVLAVFLAQLDILPFTAALAMAILLCRAIFGLSKFHHSAPAKRIGILEIVYGVLTVGLITVGYVID